MIEGVFLAALAARTAIVAAVVIVGLRLLGKRALGQMNIYDLAMIMALSNAVQNAMTHGSGHLLAGTVSAGVLLVTSALVAAIVLRRPAVETRLVGSPMLLAHNGVVVRENLRRAGVTDEQLETAARERGLTGVGEILIATLEVDGTISIIETGADSRRYPDTFSTRARRPHRRHRAGS